MKAMVADQKAHPAPPPSVMGVMGGCEHGGRSFEVIGDEFDDLSRRGRVVAADVLDAWFDPAPEVIEALREHAGWLARASPPTGCEGLVRAIARARGVGEGNILPGAGSSALIYLAFTRWLTPSSRALVVSPTYGEYAHVLERVVGCRVERLELREEEGFEVPLEALGDQLAMGRYDLAVIVNPNNPTGTHIGRERLEAVLAEAHPRTRVWVDEAYAEYGGADVSVERFASVEGGAGRGDVVVCKTMSKVYALSGLRAAYLCGPERVIGQLRSLTPPWAVSLPAQVAGVRALACGEYYRRCWARTHELRAELAARLREVAPWRVMEGCLNAVLCVCPAGMPDTRVIAEECRRQGVYVRDCSAQGAALAGRALRVAVREREEAERIVRALEAAAAP